MKFREYIRDEIFTIEDVCTAEECAAFIERAEGIGFADAPITTGAGFVVRKDVRNNTRVMLDDFDLADLLWKRVARFMPEKMEDMVPLGLNERFRFYRYDIGQYFAPHLDGCFRRGNGEESLLTFMLYLNDEYVGGETNFDLRHPYGEIKILGKTGMVLCFFHYLRHEGAEVLVGRKYVLRTDVMFRTED